MFDHEADRSKESLVVEALVGEAARGSRTARERLLQQYWHVIRSAVRARRQRMGQQVCLREETDDLEQEVALHLLDGFGKHEWRGRHAFIAWIKMIAGARVADLQKYHRAAKRGTSS